MDDSRFDHLSRFFGTLRSRRGAVAAIGTLAALPMLDPLETDAKKKKKKKKPCAKKCPSGCCTSKTGTCIQPNQQTSAQCGTGGAICRSTGCAGTCPNCQCSASAPCPAGQCCRGDGTCGACLVFVTSSKHTGNLGGLAVADAICQNLASTAGLPGTYQAWLSTSGASPSTRFTKSTGPYTLVDGTIVTDSWNDLTDLVGLPLKHPINKTQTGSVLSGGPSTLVWTGTMADGKADTSDTNYCENWTSAVANGTNNAVAGYFTTDANWTESVSDECNQEHYLYCFQQS